MSEHQDEKNKKFCSFCRCSESWETTVEMQISFLVLLFTEKMKKKTAITTKTLLLIYKKRENLVAAGSRLAGALGIWKR